MKTCGNCVLFKNGCDFSMSKLPTDTLKKYVACADYIDRKDFEKKLSKVERKIGVGR